MKRVRTSEELSNKILGLFQAGKDRLAVAQELSIPYSTVCKVVARSENDLADADELTKLKAEFKALSEKYNKAIFKLIEHGILKVNI